MEALIARAFQILLALGGAYLLTLWFALVVWTFRDIQERSRSVVSQIFSTLVVMIFFLPGLLVYLILRPRYTLDDAFQRSLEEEYLMQDLQELPLCPGCHQYIEDEWVYCPHCQTELRDNCVSCDRLIDLRWEICPYCGTEQYVDDETGIPAPPAQPVLTEVTEPVRHRLDQPFAGLTRSQVGELEQPTRPIIPAAVRVDLRSGSIDAQPEPRTQAIGQTESLQRLEPPLRVSLDGNGTRPESDGREDDAPREDQPSEGNGSANKKKKRRRKKQNTS